MHGDGLNRPARLEGPWQSAGWSVGPARAVPHPHPARRTWAGYLLAWFVACAERRRQRWVLAALEDRLLDDIGRTRAEARAEANRPFWR
jgi:uncharacterized protein YjiS (DUF1127 family)